MSRRPIRGVAALSGRRRELGALWLTAVMVGAACALVVVAHDSMRTAETEGVRSAVAEADPARLRLSVRLLENVAPGPAHDPIGDARALLDETTALIPPSVSAQLEAPRLVIDTNRFAVTAIGGSEPASPTFLTLRIHPDIDQHTTVVEGRAATADTVSGDLPRVEIELSADTAQVLGAEVGSVMTVGADITDTTTRQFEGGIPQPFEVVVVGLRAALDTDDPYWFGDDRLQRPTVSATGVGADYFAFASVPLDSLLTRPYLVRGASPLVIEQRQDLTSDPLDLDDAEALADGLRSIEALAVDRAAPGRPAVVMGLRPVLDDEARQRTAARSVVTAATGGTALLALLVVIGVIDGALVRRREWWDVARARGASRAQLVASATTDLGGAAVVGALIGTAVAGAVATVTATALVIVGALAVGGLVCSIALAITATGPVSALARRAATSALLVATVAAAVTVGRRGAAGGGAALLALLCVAIPAASVIAARPVTRRLLVLSGRRGLRWNVGTLVGLRRAAVAPNGVVTAVLASGIVLVTLGSSVDTSIVGVSEDPLARMVSSVHAAVAVTALTLSTIAVVVDALLAGRRRSRDLTLVTLVTAAPRESVRAAWAEAAPIVVLASIVGGLSGLLVVAVFGDAVDLSPFWVVMTPSWSGLVTALAVLSAVTTVVVLVASRWTRHFDAAAVMREHGSV